MQQPVPISLLSPARDLAVGKAAIDSGADAVYIGAPKYGARAAAGNSIDDIAELANYAHQFDVKVLVTLNTLLTDEERQEAVELAWQLYKAGADALIIQDLNLLKENLPPIRLHASTQCDNRSLEDVLARQQDGFQRVVLARELTLEQIKEIRQNTTVELEAFVHGALCVSYSGKCFLSEYVCGRSANRGCCAQLCRQPYDLLDKDGNELLHGKYVLSLKDMDRSQYLKELLDAGITTLKIEGRLKDAAYVRNITAYYRQRLDQLFADPHSPYCKASKGNIRYDFIPDPAKTFHRSATDYFLHGRTADMADWETPKSTGEYVGKVSRIGKNYIEVATSVDLHNGDGLCYADKGFLINKVEKSVSAAIIYPNRMPQITVGTHLYRNYDILFQRQLENSKTCRRLPVSISLVETDNGFRLRIGEREQVFVCEKTPATNAERAMQTIRQQLSKLGDTIYEATDITIDLSQPYFIPVSSLNAWRREVAISAPHAQPLSASHPDAPPSADTDASLAHPITRSCIVTPLMTCRYCILHEMGQCRKQRQATPDNIQPLQEPAFLRHGKQLFRLRFDCSRCQMTISPV